jgi:competence protein ComEA
MRQIAYVVIGVLAGFLLAGVLFLVVRSPSGEPVALDARPTDVPIEVHVIGAVLRPGLYILADGSRVQDAITAAGGLTSDADPDALNLAAKLKDGQQLDVPSRTGAPTPGPEATAGFRILPQPGGTPTARSDLIDINTATADQLASLPGIGPTTAQRIVDYRTENGPFARIEDLLNVPGIGPATFDNIRDLITL